MPGWDSCTLEPNWVLRWIECHPGTASWVQALGTIAALIAAIALTRFQVAAATRQETEHRTAKARALAYLMAPHVARIAVDVARIERTISDDDYGMALITPSIVTRDNAVAAMTFSDSGDRPSLYDIEAFPPDAAMKAIQLFSFVDDFNGYICEYLPFSRSLDGELRGAFIDDVDRKFAAIKSLSNEVSQLLTSISHS